MKHITVDQFKDILVKKKGEAGVDFINVCTPAEYAVEHIEGVRSVPLDELGEHLAEFKDKKEIYIHCRSGNRGRIAIAELQQSGIGAELINVEGGLMAWGSAGYQTNSL
jgi:rhodanese-related sulfurtransferase